MRRILIAAMFSVTLAACAHPTVPQQQAIDCAKEAGNSVIANAGKILTAAARGDWFVALEEVLQSVGPSVICEARALMAMLNDRAHAPTPSVLAGVFAVCGVEDHCPMEQIQSAHIEAWLRFHSSDYK